MDVAIVGCGYVGMRLGELLREAGYAVVGVRRSAEGVEEIERRGLTGVRADATDPETLSPIPDVDWLVYAASAGRGGIKAARETYLHGVEHTIETFGGRDRPPTRFIYTSSTGVYGDHGGGWVDETTPPDPIGARGRLLLEAEQRVLSHAADHDIDPTVVRFAGLYGPGRYRLDRYLTGPVTEGVLNLVHREDAAGAIFHLLVGTAPEYERYLAVDDEPVDRWDLADWLADELQVDPPPKQTLEERSAEDDLGEGRTARLRANKRCRNTRLKESGYELRYPTYQTGYREALEEVSK